jgi:hypothetical protein
MSFGELGESEVWSGEIHLRYMSKWGGRKQKNRNRTKKGLREKKTIEVKVRGWVD